MSLSDVESAPVLQCDGVCSCGTALRPTFKDEDRVACLVAADSDSANAFGVFDGHNGKGAAEQCASEDGGLCARILALDSPADREGIEKLFWEMDESIGLSGETAGTTATVFVCTPSTEGMQCALAWVGDSEALHMDVSPNRPCKFEGQVLHTSTVHKPADPEEATMIATLDKIRRQVEERRQQQQQQEEDHGHRLLETTAREVLGGRTPSDSELQLYHRAVRRSELIAATMPCEGHTARRRHIIGKRLHSSNGGSKAKPSRTLVVATADSIESPDYFDLAMSRSLGDWIGPDMVLPHPSVLNFEVPFGQHSRVILASDGFWNRVEHAEASESARGCETAQEAAEVLLLVYDKNMERRKAERNGDAGRIDDVAIVVVDVNPSQLKFEPPSLSFRLGCPCPSMVLKIVATILCLLCLVPVAMLPLLLGEQAGSVTNATKAHADIPGLHEAEENVMVGIERLSSYVVGGKHLSKV